MNQSDKDAKNDESGPRESASLKERIHCRLATLRKHHPSSVFTAKNSIAPDCKRLQAIAIDPKQNSLCCFVALRGTIIKIFTPATLKQQSNKDNSFLCVFPSLREKNIFPLASSLALNPPRLCCFVALREKTIKIFTPATLKQQSNKDNSFLCVFPSLREKNIFPLASSLALNPPRLCCFVALREKNLTPRS